MQEPVVVEDEEVENSYLCGDARKGEIAPPNCTPYCREGVLRQSRDEAETVQHSTG